MFVKEETLSFFKKNFSLVFLEIKRDLVIQGLMGLIALLIHLVFRGKTSLDTLLILSLIVVNAVWLNLILKRFSQSMACNLALKLVIFSPEKSLN